MEDLKIVNGIVYDPLNGIDGERLDIHVSGGKIAERAKAQRVIDVKGMVVMPGGVDIHSHIAGPKINMGRRLRPENHRTAPVPKTDVTRAGVGGGLSSTFVTGYRYAAMGYTTVMEPAVPPLMARHAHEELNDIPMVDKGCYVLMGNNEYIISHIHELNKVENYVKWLLNAAKGYAIKAVNPCGSDNWKWGENVHGLGEKGVKFDATPKEMITTLSEVNKRLKLPHPLHLHTIDLGVPGNYETTLETLEMLKGKRAHLTHLQFNCYGGSSWKDLSSEAGGIAEKVNDSKITVDSGQVIFGDVTTMTADAPWQYRLYRLSGNKWVNNDVEVECGGGIVPYRYRKKNSVNATQWAIGLELLLMIEDPWRVYLSTDNPNGGSFTSYPYIIKLLMDKKFRKEELSTLHQNASSTSLPDIDREYTLGEIATITRGATAKSLGLKNKGHLGVGADADIAIYPLKEDIAKMFSKASYVIKDGDLVVGKGKIISEKYGKTFMLDFKEKVEPDPDVREFFKYYTVDIENYPVEMAYLPRYEAIKCG